MPRVHKRKARADIYKTGFRSENKDNKRGYTLDRSKPADDKDEVIIPKGTEYYTWQFKGSSPSFSLTPPKRDQLTRNEWQLWVYGIEDRVSEFEGDNKDDLEAFIEELKSDVSEQRDELQGRLDNMPESLQYAPSGETLQTRIDALESYESDLDGIDIDDCPDEDEAKQEYVDDADFQDEYDEEPTSFDDLTEDDKEKFNQDYYPTKVSDWVAEKVEELNGFSLDC